MQNEISLLELPGHLYLEVENNFKKEFFSLVLSKTKTCSGLARLLHTPRSNIDSWIKSRGFPLWILKKIYFHYPEISKEFPISVFEKKINLLRGMTNLFGIKNPKLPIVLTPKLASVLGHFLGDGGIKKRDLTPIYCNIYADVIAVFLSDLSSAFGKVDYNIERRKLTSGELIYCTFPTALGLILVKNFGFYAGKKVKNVDLGAPEVILESSDDEIKSAFVRALFDDEGNVNFSPKEIRLQMSNEQIVVDLRDILMSLGISCNPISKFDNHGNPAWYFSISSQKDILLFKELVGSCIREKNDLLEKLLNSYQTPFAYARLEEKTKILE